MSTPKRLAGSCYAAMSMLSCLQEANGERPPFVVATGGMSVSAPWCQLLADATRHQIRVRPLSRAAGVAGAVLVTGDERLARVDDDEVLVYEQCSAVADEHLEGHARYEMLYKTLQYKTSQYKTSQYKTLQYGHDAQPAADDRTS